jgi:hypothetical protein
MTMSRKPSTAALDSFRHESFRTRRRAPRHPAGENIRGPVPTVSRDSAMNCHPEPAPSAGEGSAFHTSPVNCVSKQRTKQTKIAQPQIAIPKEEAMNRNHKNRGARSTQLDIPALLRITLALFLVILGITSAPAAHAQTKPHRVVKTYPINRANAENLQRWVNADHDTWCLDPKLVAARTLEQFAPGLTDSTYELASQLIVRKLFHDNTAIYTYHSLDGQTTYRLTLRRPPWLRPTAGSTNKTVWIPDRLETLTNARI